MSIRADRFKENLSQEYAQEKYLKDFVRKENGKTAEWPF